MLSILIPIYGCKIVELVKELVDQCKKEQIDFEVICLDDGSKANVRKANRTISGMFGVNYVELSENAGRAKTRNKLGALARYEHLLFLDCDSKIIIKDFISQYVKVIKQYPDSVICGGRIYTSKSPDAASKYLHWLYGTKRESRKAKFRNLRPVELLHSNNLVIPASIHGKIPFNEDIIGYGYEDIALACKIVESHDQIRHIDNNILHAQLDSSAAFIEKVKHSTANLAHLYKSGQIVDTRLIRAYKRVRALGIRGLLYRLLRSQIARLTRNLNGNRPKIFYLDLLKLYYFIKHIKEK